MVGIPLWLWFAAAGLLFVSMLVAWVIYAHRAFRTDVRRRFLLHLEARYPQIEILEEMPGHLRLKSREGEPATLFLRRLYGGAADLDLHDEEGYRELFDLWAGVVLEGTTGGLQDPETDRVRLLPRLVTPGFLRGISDGREDLPCRPLEGLGLFVVFVLDGRHSVSFVNEDMLASLRLDAEGAWGLALDNLRQRSGELSVAEILEGEIQAFKSEDTYAAARLLLIPEQLAPGQLLAAAIPDRDTLVLAPMPLDGDWNLLKKIAKVPSGEALLEQPVKVSREGFQLV